MQHIRSAIFLDTEMVILKLLCLFVYKRKFVVAILKTPIKISKRVPRQVSVSVLIQTKEKLQWL